MNEFQGADTEALRGIGSTLGGRAGHLEDLASRLAAVIGAVRWEGPDADAFRADWAARVQPGILDCGSWMREDGRELEDHAEHQDQASDPGSEVAGAGPGGAVPGVVPALPGAVGGALSGAAAGAAVGGAGQGAGGPEIELMAFSAPLGAASPEVPPAEPMSAAQQVSDAIGTGSPLVFDGTGLVLEPPETTDTVEVGKGHDLAPARATDPFGLDADGEPLDLAPRTKYEVGDHGTFYTDADGDVVHIEATGGGERMNPNLREVFPDANYHVNENVFYSTDELGRLDHMYVREVELHPDTSRSQSIQSKIAERFDMTTGEGTESIEFNAGHALARQFGGVREEINYTRQWDEVNQARSGKDTIYTFESMMADGIEDGRSYSYETRFTWGEEQPPGVGPGEGSEPWEYVPESYDVHITEGGEQVVHENLPNYPDGARFTK